MPLSFSTLFRRAATPVPSPEPERRGSVGEAPEAKRATVDAHGWYWLQHPVVMERANRLVSGKAHMDAYGHLAEFLGDNGIALPLASCAILGCGSGNLERDLVRRGMVGEVDAYDQSEDAIVQARRLAAEQGFGAIRYHVADLGPETLPDGQVDAVFSHSAVHRVERLEELFATVRRVLRTNGIFHLNEFLGPSRFQWADAQLRLINQFLETLPDRLLQTPRGRKQPVQRPTVEHKQAKKPTQATRSSEVRDLLRQSFEIAEERPFGGTLLHMGLDGIAQNFDPSNPEDAAHLQRFFDLEDQTIRSGAIGSDFVVLTARPKSVADAHSVRPSSASALFGAPPTRQLRPPDGFNMPGLDLTVSKADTMLAKNDDPHYLSVGRSALSVIERALGGVEPSSILDLPCGFGRVSRMLRARFPNAAMTVSDLDRPGVDFSASQFGARAVYSVRDFRELEFGEKYDLIWVGSLMTHLPGEATEQLFAALERHLTQEGAAVITLQGPSVIPQLRATGYGLPLEIANRVIQEFERCGYGYADYVGGEDVYGVSLTNEHYGISLTDKQWIAAALARSGLRLGDYEVRGWDNHHDVVTAHRRHSKKAYQPSETGERSA